MPFMTLLLIRRDLVGVCAAALLIPGAWSADSSRIRTESGQSTAAVQRSGTARPGVGKGPLPDPVLLDGSKMPAEKKSDYGMIGDFELPGDENARNGKVGGPQNPGQQPPGGGNPIAMPQAGGGPQSPQDSRQAASQSAPQPAAEQAGGGASKADNAAANQAGGSGEPGAKPEGVQVAQLGGEPSGEQASAGAGEKPPPVAIGDSAMRIPATQSAAGTVGGQQQVVGNTQHHEKGTGTGGRPPTGVQGNNRVEKGRTIPAGL